MTFAALVAVLSACSTEPPAPGTYAGSAACSPCHVDAQAAWESSAHARAERDIGPDEREALQTLPGVTIVDGAPHLGGGEVSAVIGVSPLWQPLVTFADGRTQAYERAWDTTKLEWFDVFDSPAPEGTFAHWTGRGMTWNSQCAPCHDTGVRIGWADNRYATTFVERGVGCEACHGPAARHAADPAEAVPVVKPGMDTCLPCHSRRAALTDQATESYLDGYAPLLAGDSALFWPDGQVRGEVFEGVPYLGSRMYAAGVRCDACHSAHTSKLVRDGNDLCLGCHAATEPHDHHAVGSAGAQCTGCHMPTKTFMQRQDRHDHGFTIPDPALGVSHGVPDACTGCHRDRDAAWAAEVYAGGSRTESRGRSSGSAREAGAPRPSSEGKPSSAEGISGASPPLEGGWYGAELRPSQVRSRAFASGDTPALTAVTHDTSPLWRANAVAALAGRGDAAARLASDPDALVRAAAGGSPTDPVRLSRVAHQRASRRSIHPDAAEGRDLRAYLDINADQPAAALELGRWWLEHAEPKRAFPLLERAVAWDPDDAQAELTYALAALRLRKPGAARAALLVATERAPGLVEAWLALALVHREEGDLIGAVEVLERGEAHTASPRLPRARAGFLRQMKRYEQAVDAEAKAAALGG